MLIFKAIKQQELLTKIFACSTIGDVNMPRIRKKIARSVGSKRSFTIQINASYFNRIYCQQNATLESVSS